MVLVSVGDLRLVDKILQITRPVMADAAPDVLLLQQGQQTSRVGKAAEPVGWVLLSALSMMELV